MVPKGYLVNFLSYVVPQRLITDLFCKIHDVVVHCAGLVKSRYPGDPERGHSLKLFVAK